MNIKDLVKSKMRSSDYKLIYDGLDHNDSDSPVLIYTSKGPILPYTIREFYTKFDSLIRKLGYELEEEENYSKSGRVWCRYMIYRFQDDFRPDMPEEIMFSVATPPYADMLPISPMINIAFFLWYDRD